MRDFTVTLLDTLIKAFLDSGYDFITYRKYAEGAAGTKPYVILRHDVDKKPFSALDLARHEYKLNVKGTYYIRNAPDSFNNEVVKEIAAMGHEIGYHYEDYSRNKGDIQQAEKDFISFLQKLRQIASVNTICMHGSPLSKFDNKTLWRYCDYHKHGILSELYLDTDFSKMLYLTDTGRGWNSRFNIRDKVKSSYSFDIKQTKDIITHLENKSLPDKIMITLHPQRWSNHWGKWLVEWVGQNTRNMGKLFFLRNQS